MSKINISDLVALQKKLAARTSLDAKLETDKVAYIAGCDVSITPDKKHLVGVISKFSWPDLKLLEIFHAYKEAEFPYIPGLLSFRELPVLLKVVESLNFTPDLVIVDGHGYSHPRRFGLACHLGLETGWPAIGCGKSKLVGTFEEPGIKKGNISSIIDKNEKIGNVVRTRTGVKPLWVSAGHKVSHQCAADWILRTCTKYRLPEPIRASHNAASKYRKLFCQENYSR